MPNQNVTPLPFNIGGGFDLVGAVNAGANLGRLLGQGPPSVELRPGKQKVAREQRAEQETQRRHEKEMLALQGEETRKTQRAAAETQVELAPQLAELEKGLHAANSVADARASMDGIIQFAEQALNLPPEEARQLGMRFIKAKLEGDEISLDKMRGEIAYTDELRRAKEAETAFELPKKLEALSAETDVKRLEAQMKEIMLGMQPDLVDLEKKLTKAKIRGIDFGIAAESSRLEIERSKLLATLAKAKGGGDENALALFRGLVSSRRGELSALTAEARVVTDLLSAIEEERKSVSSKDPEAMRQLDARANTLRERLIGTNSANPGILAQIKELQSSQERTTAWLNSAFNRETAGIEDGVPAPAGAEAAFGPSATQNPLIPPDPMEGLWDIAGQSAGG